MSLGREIVVIFFEFGFIFVSIIVSVKFGAAWPSPPLPKIKIETGKAFKQGHLFYKNRGFKIVKEDEEDFYMEKFL